MEYPTMKTLAQPAPSPAPSPAETKRLLARLARARYEALDDMQRGYVELLADYLRPLGAATGAAEAIAAAAPAGFRSGFHDSDGTPTAAAEDAELWDDAADGARAVARLAKQ